MYCYLSKSQKSLPKQAFLKATKNYFLASAFFSTFFSSFFAAGAAALAGAAAAGAAAGAAALGASAGLVWANAVAAATVAMIAITFFIIFPIG